MCAEVDRRADRLIDVVPPDPRPPRAGLRGALRPRPADRRARGRGRSTSSAAAYGRRHRVRGAGPATAGPTVAVLCEYDALPGIGHACGHNIIAAAGLGRRPGRRRRWPTRLGGRVRRARHAGRGGRRRQDRSWPSGAPSTGVDAAMMVHPAGADLPGMDVHRHPAARRRLPRARPPTPPPSPHRGRNALDAAVLGYMNVAALRQHIRPTSASTASSPTAATSRTSCPPTPRPSGTSARRRIAGLAAAQGAGRWPASRPGAAAAGCTMELRVEATAPYADMRRQRSRCVDALRRQRRARSGRTVGRPDARAPAWSAAPTWATSATSCRRSTR